MKIENHIKSLNESFEEIENAIKLGVTRRQRTIGFHASVACADMFELILHKKNLLPIDVMIKHEWFASPNIMKEKFNFQFEGKEHLLGLITEIERVRNTLCYGSPQDEELILKVVRTFNEVKSIFLDKTS